ncbi:MAG TPA: hypothetical protein VH252_08710 [Chthoniobacterales bacterium]|jgi:hypothetical protein|nr:hypothetical protein [Chthoniobacterales bacterium]
MQIVSQQTPAPRLLSTVVPELREKAPERANMRSRLKSSATLFAGNGRAIFVGLLSGAILICAIAFFYEHHQADRRRAAEEERQRQLLAASAQVIPAPKPIMVQISSDLIHVTAISLGHPHIAIINGKLVAEGEAITLPTPTPNVVVSLRVTKISDGAIELSDGTQVIIVRLDPTNQPRTKP